MKLLTFCKPIHLFWTLLCCQVPYLKEQYQGTEATNLKEQYQGTEATRLEPGVHYFVILMLLITVYLMTLPVDMALWCGW
jgi:hypothetical protein